MAGSSPSRLKRYTDSGASAFDEKAVSRVFEAKGRPSDNPLIVHIAEMTEIDSIGIRRHSYADRLIEDFFPGPLTIVLPKTEKITDAVSAGLETVAIRMPANDVARELIEKAGFPIVAPSANISGKPSPTTWESVFEDLDGRVECILQSDPTEIGLESTVVDCTGNSPVLLRAGAVSPEELRRICPDIRVSEPSKDFAKRSPGLAHKHYAPIARVKFGPAKDAPSSHAFIGINDSEKSHPKREILPSNEVYASRLFEFFRECDRDNIEHIYCEEIEETGLGRAIMDRIRRAADG